MPTPFLANVTHFGRLLRALGCDVSPSHVAEFARALDVVGLERRDDVASVGRAIFAHRRDDVAVFDRAFAAFWHATLGTGRLPLGQALTRATRETRTLGAALTDAGDLPDDMPRLETPLGHPSWSEREVLGRRDFASLTPDEANRLARLFDQRRLELPTRRSRRTKPDGRGRAPDLRHTVRASLRTGGEPLRLHRRSRRIRERPLVVLCDISGSMRAYSRILLQFVYALGRDARRFEAFAFGTRLTRLSRLVDGRDVDRALADAAASIVDWGGGTRIGESLRTFNFVWGRRVLGRGAVVLLISDGWDRGDPGLLAREMDRLHRSCHRLMWLNPLLGLAEYEPLTRGMQAALPHVDDFLPVHNLRSLEQLAEALVAMDHPPSRRRRWTNSGGTRRPAAVVHESSADRPPRPESGTGDHHK